MSNPKIQTKIFEYGDENESEWPPKYGTGKGGCWYYDKETRKMVEGRPPPTEKTYGQAPYVIGDTLKQAYYHPGAERWTESRSQLNALDNATGTITTDKKLPPDPSNARERERLRRLDHKKSLREAVQMVDAGTAPLSEETKEKCRIHNEVVSKALGMDAFNVAGRKNDPRGKKYRRK
jgi:hypothetical protein